MEMPALSNQGKPMSTDATNIPLPIPRANSFSDISEEEIRIFRQQVSSLRRQYKPASFTDKCLYCKKSFVSPNHQAQICNSHSIPQSSLKSISANGHLRTFNSFIQLPFEKELGGTMSAGTFRLICRDCDSTIFSGYENFDMFHDCFLKESSRPGNQLILNQIAMKNYLHQLYKSYSAIADFSISLQKITAEQGADSISASFMEENLEIEKINLSDHRGSFETTKKWSARKNLLPRYTVDLYQKIDGQLPVAFQSSLAITHDLEDHLVNDTLDKRAKIQNLHVCIFPSRDATILLIFHKTAHTKLDSLARQLCLLSQGDQIKATIALALRYSENLFISEKLDRDDFVTEYTMLLAADTGSSLSLFESEDPFIGNTLQTSAKELGTTGLARRNIVKEFAKIPSSLSTPLIS
jgi:hypothetical protein